jgi:putative transposase
MQGELYVGQNSMQIIGSGGSVFGANQQLGFIQPGKPTQNAFVESLNGKFRNECLNQHWFRDINEAERIIEQWREHYNHVRPHSSLKYMTPVAFANRAA